jgi:hypothetical protein
MVSTFYERGVSLCMASVDTNADELRNGQRFDCLRSGRVKQFGLPTNGSGP